MEYSLDDLEKDAKNYTNRLNELNRSNYQYAKSLGFTPAECSVLKSKNKVLIKELAIQRGYIAS